MKFILLLPLIIIWFGLISLVFPAKSEAIVILAPLILIPLAKLLAIIFASLAFPASAIGALWSKFFHQSFIKIIIIITLSLIVILAITGGILLYLNPERPIF